MRSDAATKTQKIKDEDLAALDDVKHRYRLRSRVEAITLLLDIERGARRRKRRQ